MASDSRKCGILSAYCKKQVMGKIGGESDGWKRKNALCQTLSLIIQHETKLQIVPDHLRTAQSNNEFRLCLLSLAPHKDHPNYIMTEIN